MSWGIDGPFTIPDGTTWDGITGREWESSGASMEWSGFNYEFHLYYDLYPWSTPAWTEITTLGIESFDVQRGVRSWWEGMSAGSATINLVNDQQAATRHAGIKLNAKMRLTVDTPSGEHDLFTGWVTDEHESYTAESASVRIVLQDWIGYTGQQAIAASASGGPFTTGDLLRWALSTYANGYTGVAEIAGVTAAVGLLQTGIFPAGNLLDFLNQLIRGELGLLWVDASGVWQSRERDWWYPKPDPVATIGSTDRGAGGVRFDPSLADSGYRFAATATNWSKPLSYNQYTWTGPFPAGTQTAFNASSESGLRKKTDTVLLTVNADATNNLSFLVQVTGPDSLTSNDVLIEFPADLSLETMEYAARADVTDFVEVARETLLTAEVYRREWSQAWVMGVSHHFDPYSGWTCYLRANPNLAFFGAVPT